jgi:hypothetical protein
MAICVKKRPEFELSPFQLPPWPCFDLVADLTFCELACEFEHPNLKKGISYYHLFVNVKKLMVMNPAWRQIKKIWVYDM